MIEVILLERVERLGTLGQVVKVKPGFARNYLLPMKKALRATKANRDVFEAQRAQLEAANAKLKAEAEVTAKQFEGLELTVIRQASEAGMLYGAVTGRDVSEAAKDKKMKIERSMIEIPQAIKAVGIYPIRVKLHPEVSVLISVNVARSEDDARAQVKKLKDEKAAAEALSAAPTEGEPTEDAKEAKKAAKTKKAKADGETEAAAPAEGEDKPKKKAKKKAE